MMHETRTNFMTRFRFAGRAATLALVGWVAGAMPSRAQPWPVPGLRSAADAPVEAAAAASRLDLPTTGPLRLTVEGAIALALANNRSLAVSRLDPAIRRSLVEDQRAVFDPVLAVDLAASANRLDVENAFTGGRQVSVSRRQSAGLTLSQAFPTGTTIQASIETTRQTSGPDSESWATRAGLSVSQHLLRGLGPAVNWVSLRQARLDALSSDYELRGLIQTLVAQVESAYWDHLLAQRQLAIFEEAMRVAQEQLDQTLARIEVGTLAQTERYAAEAEVAQRRVDLIDARSRIESTRLALQRLLGSGAGSLAPRPIELLSDPILPDAAADAPEEHLAVALRLRPDLNQARLALARNELEIVRTRNGLLPVLDLFLALGHTGYAASFSGSVDDLEGGNSSDWTAQLALTYPLGNRAARARHQRAQWSREQQALALANLSELVEQDVRGALIELDRVRAQVAATAASRVAQEQTLRAEQEKFAVGRSTTLLVSRAERDLISAQIAEVQAAIAYLKAIVNLYRLDGSLLTRRGIECPGGEPAPQEPEAALRRAGG